jgi:peptide/nickel transport system permease protein
MASKDNNTTTIHSEITPRVSEWKRFRRVFLGRPLVVFGMAIMVIYIIVAIFAPLLAPYPPNQINLSLALNSPNSSHWLGNDPIGRDTLSRIIFGTRTALLIGLVVVALAGLAGGILGTVAGYYGGMVHAVIMRIVDALMSFPMILLAMVVAALLGSGIRNVIIALSVAMVSSYARLMCAQVLSVKENDYISAERSLGSSSLRIMLMHVVPNCLSAMLVLVTMNLGSVVLAEAGLSFLGIGIAPPTPAWGSMINDAKQYLIQMPILSFAPGVALMLLVFAFNMVGDGLRDALDPRLRGTI